MHVDNICSFLLSKHLVGFDIAYSEIVVVEPANCLTRFWHFKRHLPYYILYIVFFYWVTSGTFCLDVILAGSHVINGLLGNITCPTFPVEYFSLYIYTYWRCCRPCNSFTLLFDFLTHELKILYYLSVGCSNTSKN